MTSAPAITVQPSDQSVSSGQPATFTVTATGTGTLSYQWQKNAVPIAGATAPIYTTPATALGDSGSSLRRRRQRCQRQHDQPQREAARGKRRHARGNRCAHVQERSEPQRSKSYGIDPDSRQCEFRRAFGLLRNLMVDGKVDAQPLYVSQLSVSGSAAQRGVRGHRARLGLRLRRRYGLGSVACVAARIGRNLERHARLQSSDPRNRHHVHARHRSQRRRAWHPLCGRHVEGCLVGLSSAAACARSRHRRRIAERTGGDRGDLPDRRRRHHHVQSRPVRRTGGAAAAERNHLHELDFALRHRARTSAGSLPIPRAPCRAPPCSTSRRTAAAPGPRSG